MPSCFMLDRKVNMPANADESRRKRLIALKSPIQLVMSYFGYVKIPVQVVQLSMAQEEAFKKIVTTIESTGHEAVAYRKVLAAQQALTAFLRSGRLIT